MKEKEQVTFNDEPSILAAIEEAQAKSSNLLQQSAELEQEARELIRYGDAKEAEEGRAMLKESASKDRAAQRISGELNKLKESLAAFRTGVMPQIIPQSKTQKQVVVPK